MRLRLTRTTLGQSPHANTAHEAPRGAEDVSGNPRIHRWHRSERDLPDGFDGLTLPTKLLVRPSRIRALWVLRVLHELAHHYLARRFHTHADVWRLTLALAWPVDRVKRGVRPLEIPAWSLALRGLILEESRVISAA